MSRHGRVRPSSVARATLVGLVICPIILSVLGIVFGVLARKELDQDPTQAGRGLANWGFWLGIVGLAIGVPVGIYIATRN